MPITHSDFQFFRFTSLGFGILVAPASVWTAVILQQPWQVCVRVYSLGNSKRSPVPSQLRKCFRQAHNGPSVANRKSKRPRKIRSQDEGPSIQRAMVVEFHRPLRFSFCLCKAVFEVRRHLVRYCDLFRRTRVEQVWPSPIIPTASVLVAVQRWAAPVCFQDPRTAPRYFPFKEGGPRMTSLAMP